MGIAHSNPACIYDVISFAKRRQAFQHGKKEANVVSREVSFSGMICCIPLGNDVSYQEQALDENIP